MQRSLETIKNIIRNGGNIVVLGGIEVMLEAGLNGVRAEHIAYDIEQKLSLIHISEPTRH